MIYMDHSSTTAMRRPVLEAMWPYLTEHFGNPSSHHPLGEVAAAALDQARSSVSDVLGCRPAEVVFTSGGTESDNLAIKGVALARPRGRHVITTAVEHKAVLDACKWLEQHFGFRITVLPVDGQGVVDLAAFEAALTPDATLVSVMLANNEVGTVEPVAELAARCRALGVPLHTDAVQAPGWLPLDVEQLGVDLLSISAHKFHGPRGVGALYVRRGTPLAPLIDGGGQERGRRSGTENVAGAVGLAAALRLAEDERPTQAPRLEALRDRLIAGVLATAPGAVLTGHPTNRLAHHASFCFEGVNGETVLLELEQDGVCCSSGSSCAAGSTDPSHVLLALGLDPALAQTAVRLTMGASTTDHEVDQVLDLLPEALGRVRSAHAMAPTRATSMASPVSGSLEA